ncbi:MAK10-like protein [Tanacetum coccineum]
MERFKNTIFKQREEINGRMTKMFGLLKELITSKTPEKVLIREESKFPVIKNLNSISLTKGEEGGSNRTKGLVNNNRFNNSRSRTQAGKKKGKEYKVLPGGPTYDAILKKKITKKEDIGGGMFKYMAASHSYIYPLGIAKDVLVEIAEHVYPVDFVISDIRENENRPFILGTPFLTTAKASIKFDTDIITLRSGKHKVSFYRKPDSSNMIDKGVKNYIEPIAPTMTVNRLVLEWEEKKKLHLEREMQFNQLRNKNFKGMHPTLIATKEEDEDEGEVT